MKNKYFIVLLVMLVLLGVSCDSNNQNIVSPTYEIDESLGYLPLAIGNNWQYKSEQSSFEHDVKVSSRYESNGKEYFILSTLGEHSYPDTIRAEGNKIWKLSGTNEVIWFDFDMKDGSEYMYKDYNVRVKTDLTVESYSMKFTDCIGFYFDIPQIADEEIAYIFAKGIGVVRMPGAWVDLQLFSFAVMK